MHNFIIEFISSIIFAYVVFISGNALVIGACYALLLVLTANLSQGFLNPAIAIALASIGKLSNKDAIIYSLVQIAGVLVGYELFKRYKI